MSFIERCWWAMTVACVVWYSTITIYVAVRGAVDIRFMLRKLAEQHGDGDDDDAGGPTNCRSARGI
jgi:hypothetical protein